MNVDIQAVVNKLTARISELELQKAMLEALADQQAAKISELEAAVEHSSGEVEQA